MKTAMTGTYAAKAVDIIIMIFVIAVVIVLVSLVCAFYYICWQTLSTKSHAFVTVWAIVATTLIIIGSLVGCGAGLYLGMKQSDFVLDGVKLAVGQVIQAAEQVSEVRVTTMGRYSRLGERKGTQEWVIDNDIFGIKERPGLSRGNGEIIDMPVDIPADMPVDQTGKLAE